MDDEEQRDGPDEMDDLGAAPTLPVSGPDRDRNRPTGGGGTSRRSRRRPKVLLVAVIAIVVALALLPVATSTLKKTPRNMVGISYGGGPVESAHFQKVVMPGSGLFFNGFFDQLYLYPSDTQNYIVSKTVGEGAVSQPDSIIAPTSDRVQVEYQIAVYFKLNINRLRAFHEQLGLQYNAYTNAGWKKLIQATFRQQLENALQEETRKYEVADLFSNAADLTTIQTDVEKKLSDRLSSALGQSFFCGPTYELGRDCSSPTFVIKKIDLPPDVVRAFQDNRTSEIQVLTGQNQIAQRQAEAQAIEALNSGLAQAGMPYVLLKAIESGKVTFWVLPDGSNVTIPATANGAAPAAPAAPPAGG